MKPYDIKIKIINDDDFLNFLREKCLKVFGDNIHIDKKLALCSGWQTFGIYRTQEAHLKYFGNKPWTCSVLEDRNNNGAYSNPELNGKPNSSLEDMLSMLNRISQIDLVKDTKKHVAISGARKATISGGTITITHEKNAIGSMSIEVFKKLSSAIKSVEEFTDQGNKFSIDYFSIGCQKFSKSDLKIIKNNIK
jgi:hypothetical protein